MSQMEMFVDVVKKEQEILLIRACLRDYDTNKKYYIRAKIDDKKKKESETYKRMMDAWKKQTASFTYA